MKRTLSLLASLMLVLMVGFAVPTSARPLDVSVVLDLIQAGVSENSIQRYVQRNHFTFELTADDLKELKKAGASDQLIEFLQATEEQPETAPEATDQTSGEVGGTMEYSSEPQTGTADYGVAYASPSVTFGFGFGYPYYYSSFYYPYYPSYYYPYYPYYPCHYYPYYGYGHGSGSHGTGVYSYWYQNQQRMTGPRGTSPQSSSTTMSSPRLSYPTAGGGRSVYSQGRPVSPRIPSGQGTSFSSPRPVAPPAGRMMRPAPSGRPVSMPTPRSFSAPRGGGFHGHSSGGRGGRR